MSRCIAASHPIFQRVVNGDLPPYRLPSQPKQPKPSMDYVAKQRQANKPPPQDEDPHPPA